MTLKLNGSSSGYTAIDAPATAGSNTLVLPANNGSAGQVLQTDGSGNLSWATLANSGRILQVVTATTTTETSSTTTTYADTGLTKTINLASTGSKVLVLVNQAVGFVRGDDGLIGVGLKLMRDTTSLRVDPINPQMWKAKVGTGSGGEYSMGFHHTFVDIDSPSTAGNVTYKTQIAQDNAGTAYAQNDSRQSWIVLAEIGG